MIGWNLVLAVHVLATAAWVGGMAYALLVLQPSLAALNPAARMALLGQTGPRFFLVVWHAMPLSLLTGWAMVVGVYGGFAYIHWTINAMQAGGLAMAGVFLALFFGPWRRVRAGGPALEGAMASVRRLTAVNLVLGVATTVVALLWHFGGP